MAKRGTGEAAEVEAILDSIRKLANPEGSRIVEICRVLSTTVEPERVETLLQQQRRLGVVGRNDLNGRWRLAGIALSAVVAPPTASAPPPARPATPSKPPPASLPSVVDVGIPSERDEEGVVDHSQREVIRAPAGARMVVEAGPGFGKTAVACSRVVWLLREGIEPAKILLLSFTRTAVREMRERTRALATEIREVGAVDIRTIDSFAWRVRTGLSECPRPDQGYSENIDDTAAMLREPAPELREYLDGFDHVLVDEAQDLVGSRAVLIVAMLQSLRAEAGWTVFHDPAQAIYDWSEEGEDGGSPPAMFGDLLARLTPLPERRVLKHLHRTQDATLRGLLLGARQVVLDAQDDALERLRAALKAKAPEEGVFASTVAEELASSGSAADGLLVLVRRRGEALEISSRLTEKGIPHALRCSALPELAAPWIAPVLNQAVLDVGGLHVPRDRVEDAWNQVRETNPWLVGDHEFEPAWRLLRRIGAGGTKHTVDVGRVATRLASTSVPDEATRRASQRGPIVSTVHGSKGREASQAMLLLSSVRDAGPAEARVLYVGLSRAKEKLDVRTFMAAQWRHLPESGRPWRPCESGAQVEIGRVGDLDLWRSVSLAAASISEQQSRLAAFDGVPRAARVRTWPEQNWARGVLVDDCTVPIAALSGACVDDLHAVAQKTNKKAPPPMTVAHLRWFDVGSVGLPSVGPSDVSLPEPWQSTRLFLAPVIVGPGLIFGGSP